MIFDPAWDMPRQNWQQQGSFEVGEIPPDVEPDAEPLVCLPAINQAWLPYVMGALDQLRNPSSWLVADDDAMYTTLARVTKLREMIGIRATCMTYLIRFDAPSCQLQQSTDDGTTWTEVDGWADFATCLPPQTQSRFTENCFLEESFDAGATWSTIPGWSDNFGPCVQGNVPIIGLPPNPNDQSKDQLACSIAAYLTQSVILESMSKAVEAINTDLQLIAFGATVLTLIPEFVLVGAAYDALAAIYGVIAEGTLSDYEDALTNTELWSDVQCCIYQSIQDAGLVTPGNFSSIQSCVSTITSAPSDVISAIGDFIAALGATGMAQLSQIAGLETTADCSTCGSWCRQWDFTIDEQGWGVESGILTNYTAGVGWTSVSDGVNQELGITIGGFFGIVQSVEIIGDYLSSADDVADMRRVVIDRVDSGSVTETYTGDAGMIDAVVPFANIPSQRLHVYGYGHPMTGGNTITKIIARGIGPTPAVGAACTE